MRLDLQDLDSVRAFAKEFLSQTQQLNILVNNAGKRSFSLDKPRNRLISSLHQV